MKNILHLFLIINLPLLVVNCSPQAIPNIQEPSTYGKTDLLKKFKLPKIVKESSGLIKIDKRLWTFNDSGGKAALYQIDEHDGHIIKTVTIENARNRDWEDIAYDNKYVYIGDFGNNRGNRKDLKIYKISRKSLASKKSIKAKIIHFSYSDQKDFKAKPHNNNYDCEAMIAHRGKLYLFSKNWQDQKTRLYELSTRVGKHHAKYLATLNIQSMVTGATINEKSNILLLTTYDELLNVKIFAFSNYRNNNFFAGEKKILSFLSPPQGQIEGVTFIDNYKAYLSSESFKQYILSFDASLYELDFSREYK